MNFDRVYGTPFVPIDSRDEYSSDERIGGDLRTRRKNEGRERKRERGRHELTTQVEGMARLKTWPVFSLLRSTRENRG